MVKVNLTQIYRKSLRCFIAKYYIFCYNRIINFCFGGPRDGCFIQQALEIADQQENELSRDEAVTLAVLEKICAVVNADFGDIMEYIPEEKHD